MIGVFTFGFGHSCTCGRELKNHYTEIEGEDLVAARGRMVLAWGMRWSMAYGSREEAGIERFGMTRIITQWPWSCAGCPCGGLAPMPVYRKEPPDVPGAWWLLDDSGVEQIVDVVHRNVDASLLSPGAGLPGGASRHDTLIVFEHGVGGWRYVSECRAVGWAGPIGKPRRR